METVKYYRNSLNLQSNLIAYVILGLFIAAFLYLELYLLLGCYLLVLLIVTFKYFNDRKVLEVGLGPSTVVITYFQNFKRKKVSFALEDVSAVKIKNPAFKFTNVYNLKLYAGSKPLYEFPNEDLLEMYNMLEFSAC